MTYYKTLSSGRVGPYSSWHWPVVGEWTPPYNGDLVACSGGYHLCRRDDLVRWIDAEIYEAEIDGEVVECDIKILCRRARLTRRMEVWTERTARMFACDCAEHVLHYWTAVYQEDDRPATAIAVARRYAIGDATMSDIDAAWDSVGAAAWAAGAVARSATWDSTWAARAATWAAVEAARSATWAAARSATWDSTWAARDATWDSTWDAAGAARAAAWAAWAAASEAERAWQTKRLFRYLDGEVTE